MRNSHYMLLRGLPGVTCRRICRLTRRSVCTMTSAAEMSKVVSFCLSDQHGSGAELAILCSISIRNIPPLQAVVRSAPESSSLTITLTIKGQMMHFNRCPSSRLHAGLFCMCLIQTELS